MSTVVIFKGGNVHYGAEESITVELSSRNRVELVVIR